MLTTVLRFLGSWITKDLLIAIFKEVILEFAMDLVKEFVEDSANPYDDKLYEKFEEFLDERE